jgi:type IV secretory pathway TrbD component
MLDARDVAAQRLRVVRRRAGDVRTKASPGTIGIGSGILAAALAVVVVTWWRSNHESRRRWGRRH